MVSSSETTPVRINPTRIFIPPADKAWILEKTAEAIDSGILTEGWFCKELETQIQNYLDVRHAIVTNSGTGALELMLRSLELKGEVIVTPETFAATIYAILRAGCKPVFADVGEDMALNPAEVKTKLTGKTVAILTVHIAGNVSERTYELEEIAEKQGIPLLEDSAQAMGSRLGGKYAGTFGRSSGFSLFPTKVMGSAEGGFLVTNDDEQAGLARLCKDQGKKTGNLCTVQGYNWRMSEHQAIIALTQLRRIEEFISSRAKVATVYHDYLSSGVLEQSIEELRIPKEARPNWYKYIVFLKGVDRAVLKSRLKEKLISLSGEVYEVPCHTQPAFADLGHHEGDFPKAEEICKRHVSFPIMANLTEPQAHFFCETLKACLT